MTPEQSWFDSIYRSNFSFIRKTALLVGITRNVRAAEPWAEDMTHDTFLLLLQSISEDGLPEPRNIRGLLIVYLYHTIGNYFQKASSREQVFTEIWEVVPDFPASGPIGDVSYPIGLSKNERNLLHLRYYIGFSTAEIAEFYGISDDACRQRLHRAREHFKELHKKENGSTDFDGKFIGNDVLLGAGGKRHV